MARPRKRNTDTRLGDRELGDLRESRAMNDRATTENRELTDSQRLDEFRSQFFQSALPDLPKIPGYHVCWLTTTNPRDSIQGRMRLGYEPIRAEEIPGWEHASLKSGDWEGCVGVNEMVAFKLPEHLYEQFMRYNHFDQPNEEEEKLAEARRRAEVEASQVARVPVKFEAEEGQSEMEEDTEDKRLLVSFTKNLEEGYRHQT